MWFGFDYSCLDHSSDPYLKEIQKQKQKKKHFDFLTSLEAGGYTDHSIVNQQWQYQLAMQQHQQLALQQQQLLVQQRPSNIIRIHIHSNNTSYNST